MSATRKPAYKTEPDFGDNEKFSQETRITKNILNEETEKQDGTKVDDDWQTWDSG